MRNLTRTIVAAILWAVLPVQVAARTCPPVAPGLVGHYVLNGEREVGSQLLLRPDGQFEFMLAYGAVDQYGSGCWSVQDNTLALRVKGRKIPLRASPDDRRFRGMYLQVERDGRLGWPLPGFRGKFERQ